MKDIIALTYMAYNPLQENKKNRHLSIDMGGGDAPFIFPGQRPTQEVLKDFSEKELSQVETITRNSLASITRSRSHFRPQDVLRRVLEKSQKEMGEVVVERKTFEAMIKLIVQSMNLLAIGETGYFTTEEVANQEKMMLSYAGYETEEHRLDPNIVQQAMAARSGISEEQKEAVAAACLTNKRVTVIEGTAGAGKSFTMQAVKEAYEKSGYVVLGTALSWNAAKVLESSAGLERCQAVEGLVRDMRLSRLSGVEFFRQPTLLIVDEAGLVGTQHMFRLLDETHNSKSPVKVVLTGDSLQLNPVDSGNSLQAIVEFHGSSRIDTIRRQKMKSHRLAVKKFSSRQAGQALYPFIHQEAIRWGGDQEQVFNLVVRDFISYKNAFPEKKALILALSNKDVAEINQRVRKAYRRMGRLDSREVTLSVTDGREIWDAGFSVGDEVVLRANSKDLLVYDVPDDVCDTRVDGWKKTQSGVFNRNTGRVVAIQRSREHIGSYDIFIDLADPPRRVVLNSYKFRHQEKSAFPVVHNFATTIYASQGQTVQKVLLLDSPRIDSRLAYVGMSRHEEGVDIYLNEEELRQRMDKMIGRRQEADAPRTSKQIGRYSRAEMLQTVAASWARQSLNLTVMMFDRDRKMGKNTRIDEKALAELKNGSPEDPVTDFDHIINRKYQTIDLDRLMAAPDPLVVDGVFPGGDHEKIFQAMPGRSLFRHDPELPPPPKARQKMAILESALKWFNGQDASRDEKSPLNGVEVLVVTKNGGAVVQEAVQEVAQDGNVLSTLLDIPMIQESSRVGGWTSDGLLRFDDKGDGVSSQMLEKTKGVWWDMGRAEEPRILARDRLGEVVARYSLEGVCVVGDGYPPMLINHRAGKGVPIVIVPGAKEWLWTYEHQHQKNREETEKIPHLIWAARDVDFEWIAAAMKSSKVIIARSKTDDSQLEWAVDMQKKLEQDWGIVSEIRPSPPGCEPQHIADQKNASAGPPRTFSKNKSR